MMTQPIQMFENLTSETSPAGGNDIAKTTLTFEERRMLELRARYARAEMVANGLADALLWLGRQYSRLVGGDQGRLQAARCREPAAPHERPRAGRHRPVPRRHPLRHPRDRGRRHAGGRSRDPSAMPANQNLRRVA